MMIRFLKVLLALAMFTVAGCVDQSKIEYTRAELSEWGQLFRLYHGFHQEQALTLKTVLSEVRKATQASLPQADRSELSQNQKEKILTDAWGTEFQFSYTQDGEALVVTVISAGPDGRFGTSDDMRDSIKIDHPGKGTDSK